MEIVEKFSERVVAFYNGEIILMINLVRYLIKIMLKSL